MGGGAPLDFVVGMCYALEQVRSEVTPNIMACDRGIQGGKCSRCGTNHRSNRYPGGCERAVKTAAAIKAIKEQARRKEAAFQMRMGI